ncbi:nuclear transport factor 2 family protein [Sphingosinicellaceae bacterium]|nr:nuclear transport factor 2 family protein [Sphingosinicellaceae bacterium]
MSHSISTIMSRNLQEVFGEDDPRRRRVAIEDLWAEDGAFYAPDGVHRGHDAIERNAGMVRATHPEFRYTELGVPEEVHDTAGRVRWASGKPGDPPAYAGTDFVIVRDGKITALYMFFDQPVA